MSDTSAFGFGKFVPGFDFLQNLAKTAQPTAQATGGMAGMPSWVAPTLSIEELDKRIQELKAVQFWLEQNGTALKATIQALEVQKMTLTTLQGMNVNMADLAKAFTAQPPQPAAPEPRTATPAQESAAKAPATERGPSAPTNGRRRSKPKAAPTPVDPMAWWGSLTQQFQSIAQAAMKDVSSEALKAQGANAEQAAPGPATATRSQAAGKKTARKATATSNSRRPRSRRAP